MDRDSYKEFHESFMKNNNGTTIEETFITIIPSFFTTFLLINIVTCTNIIHIPTRFLFEFLTIVLSIILCVTVCNERIWEIAAALLFVCATSTAKQIIPRTHLIPFIQINVKRPEHIGLVRSITNLITAVCILAVDFQCFPRKLAKTENFGFGLMDTGVGLFIYSNGIIAPELRKQHNEKTFKIKVKQCLIQCLPLIVLGLARFFMIKEIDYQQHVSEYGVHWNFFLTLAATKIISTIIFALFRGDASVMAKYCGIILVTLHEMALQIGLAEYVINDECQRDTFFNANREGIISITGYVALYMASVYIGFILRNDEEMEIVNARVLLKKSLKLGFIAAVLWKMVYVCADMFGVSRRLANMGYVIWILSIGTTFTVLFMLLEVFYYFIAFDKPKDVKDTVPTNVTTDRFSPIIFSAINYNGLAFFLLANIGTGLINMLFQTMLISAGGCLFLVSIYMFVLCSIITFFYVNEIKLKI